MLVIVSPNNYANCLEKCSDLCDLKLMFLTSTLFEYFDDPDPTSTLQITEVQAIHAADVFFYKINYIHIVGHRRGYCDTQS